MNGFGHVFLALMALAVSGQARAADFSLWQKTMPITFPGYGKTEPLTNFPALIVLSTNISGFRYGDFLSGHERQFLRLGPGACSPGHRCPDPRVLDAKRG